MILADTSMNWEGVRLDYVDYMLLADAYITSGILYILLVYTVCITIHNTAQY